MSQIRINAFFAATFLIGALGCAAVTKPAIGTDGGSDAPGTGTAGTGGRAGTTGNPGTAGTTGQTGQGGAVGTGGGTGGACVSTVTCNPAGGQYCGRIGNGCVGQMLECGTCSTPEWTCDFGLCVGPATCQPTTCASGGTTRYCGVIGDNCGHSVTCDPCPSGQTCSGGVCIPANCMRGTCMAPGGGTYCGRIGDGCGGALDCGGCTAPLTCGGAGISNACGALDCPTKVSCTPMGGQYCGVIGNGCGGTVDCGSCTNGMPCGTGAFANTCPTVGPGPCQRLQCQIQTDKTACGTAITSISGRIFDPAGKNPLYNVVVYVPNAPLDPISMGAVCDRCDSPVSGQPVAAALTDATGRFKMDYAPSGTNIPLVIQIGKWRREITLPAVTACRDNAFNDPAMMRLPRNQSEGHLPKIALSTGEADAFDCLMRKIGISDSEFTNDGGSGRIHMYAGGAGMSARQGSTQLASGAAFAGSYATLFNNYTKMAGYDMLILQCEGSQLEDEKTALLGNMQRYANNGGRIFANHLHSAWIRLGLPPWPGTAGWIGVGTDLPLQVTALIDTTFPKGAALADWLVATNATPTRGQIALKEGQHSVTTTNAPYSQRWIHVPENTADSMRRPSTQYLTFNTPVGSAAANQCGRVVFTDIHVATVVRNPSNPDQIIEDMSDISEPRFPFPTGCRASMDMTPQEKALEFMFFDLSSCVQIDTGMPMRPPIPVPGGATPPPPGTSSTPPAPPPPPPPPPPPRVD